MLTGGPQRAYTDRNLNPNRRGKQVSQVTGFRVLDRGDHRPPSDHRGGVRDDVLHAGDLHLTGTNLNPTLNLNKTAGTQDLLTTSHRNLSQAVTFGLLHHALDELQELLLTPKTYGDRSLLGLHCHISL